MKAIKINSPTRVDLAGGTLDCWPLYMFVDHAVTTNVAIGISSHVELLEAEDGQFTLDITDLGFKKSFSRLQDFLEGTDPELALPREVVRYVRPRKAFCLRTSSQSPVGAGLGGSSSMTVGLIRAFFEFEDKALGPNQVLSVVELAHNIEARILGTPTGTQDYVPAFLGGANALHYGPQGLRIESLDVDLDYLSRHLKLVYTGRPHHSGLNNWQVIKACVEKDKHTLKCLSRIADISIEIYEALKSGRLQLLPDLFNQETDARIALSAGFSSPEIKDLRRQAMDFGADSVKICGAGGGGCVLIWARPEVHAKITSVCQKSGFKELPVKPVGRLEKSLTHSIEAY